MTRDELGRWLRSLRERHKMSLRQLERKSGVDYTRISRVENGLLPIEMWEVDVLLQAMGEHLVVTAASGADNPSRVPVDQLDDEQLALLKRFSLALPHLAPGIVKMIDREVRETLEQHPSAAEAD